VSYDSYRYLWPPRPEKAAPQELIQFYERRGWTAQVKKNGTCTLIFARGDEVIFKTRHNDDHKAWSPLPVHREFFAGRPGWNVYVAELLHSKGPLLKNHLYLFDILVSDGVELTGTALAERQEMLRQRFPSPRADIIGSRAGIGARMITADVSQAEIVDDPSRTWADLGPLDEGFVFKNPLAKLAPCATPTSNSNWQVKVRRPHANYSF
jgi:hypothetical protein